MKYLILFFLVYITSFSPFPQIQKIIKISTPYNDTNIYESFHIALNNNATNLASGVYSYKIKMNDFVESKKMILIK